jgi:hypothetical protein|uniref:RING-type domain-containing protein n=1 Tax=viral metagenome TaxID=1070528 RepID=A0A6C0INM7_9ZZZZ
MPKNKNDLFKISFEYFLNTLSTDFNCNDQTTIEELLSIVNLGKLNDTNRGGDHYYEYLIDTKNIMVNPELVPNNSVNTERETAVIVASMFMDAFNLFYESYRFVGGPHYKNAIELSHTRYYNIYPVGDTERLINHYAERLRAHHGVNFCNNINNETSISFDAVDCILHIRISAFYRKVYDDTKPILPFPITFTEQDCITRLENIIKTLTREKMSVEFQFRTTESSLLRRIRRLNNGIRMKDEQLKETEQKLLHKSNYDNKCLSKKIKEYYEKQIEKDSCPICYEIIEADNLYISGCCHFLCNDCADGCIHSNGKCPICREPMVKDAPDQDNTDHNEDDSYDIQTNIRSRPLIEEPIQQIRPILIDSDSSLPVHTPP